MWRLAGLLNMEAGAWLAEQVGSVAQQVSAEQLQSLYRNGVVNCPSEWSFGCRCSHNTHAGTHAQISKVLTHLV